MALFKISRGLKATLPPMSKAVDGYCYFTTDDQMFYVDYKDENGTLQRKPLNANNATTLLGKTVTGEITNTSDAIPTAAAVYAKTSNIQTQIDSNDQDITNLQNNKMDKANPTGTGYFSLNRSAGETIGTNSFAAGANVVAKGTASSAIGYNTSAVGNYSHAEGFHSSTDAESAHAEGYYTQANGSYSHAEGNQTKATSTGTHAEGNSTIASGSFSHAEGNGTKATHKSQHVQGEWNVADPSLKTSSYRGTYVHIIGNGTSDSERSNALTVKWNGDLWTAGSISNSSSTASGAASFASGNNTTASGDYSHAEGNGTKATKTAAHAEGNGTEAKNTWAHAEGNNTTASGIGSHASGDNSEAEGDYSFAHGLYTHAKGPNQVVFGKYNETNTTDIFQIGGGTSRLARSNAFSITATGEAKIKSSLNIGGATDNSGRSNLLYVSGDGYVEGGIRTGNNYYPSHNKDLVTKDYISNNLPQLTHKYRTATADETTSFDFSADITNLSTYYLVYYNGLLLIEGVHYTVNGAVVNLLDWSASTGDIVHVVGFKPSNPAT